MSDSLRPRRRWPTRLPRPWDSPGKNTGVGCHFLLQCMKGKSESEVALSCPTLRDPMVCSLPGSSIHGIFQARVLEWGAIAWGCNFLLQGIFATQGLNLHLFYLLLWQAGCLSPFLYTSLFPTARKPLIYLFVSICLFGHFM